MASGKKTPPAQSADSRAVDPKVKAAQKKKSNKRLYMGIGAVLFVLIVYVGMQPLTGTIKFGICRVFAERTLPYPTTMQIMSVEERPNDVRMGYAGINEFGEFIVYQAVCEFRFDQVSNTFLLTSVTINRQRRPASEIALFNTVIPAIVANPPSLVLPLPLPVNLRDLKR